MLFSAWEEWSQCDQSKDGQNCGGKRVRTRECRDICREACITDKSMQECKNECRKNCGFDDTCKGKCDMKYQEGYVQDGCRPFNNTIKNELYTDTDTTECSPCFQGMRYEQWRHLIIMRPSSDEPEWSQWQDWRSNSSKFCYERGEEPGKNYAYRQTSGQFLTLLGMGMTASTVH